MSIAAFVMNDILIASIYRSPKFSQTRALEEIEKLLIISSNYKIIAGDFNSHFDDEQNPFAELFSRYGLIHNLKNTLNSTTKYQSFIDNIFTDISNHTNGRYISFTSYHDPLYNKPSISIINLI
ncbi:hypothetical protein BD560DRAFT_428816 [Blakeslea trispora]|nr:hypothetical protein BD560DRAFT_428816 [Blakeslea trispora]